MTVDRQPNWLLRSLVLFSVAVHCVIGWQMLQRYRSTQVTYLELSLADVFKPSTRSIPRPRIFPKPPQELKDLPKPTTPKVPLPRRLPQPVAAPTPQKVPMNANFLPSAEAPVLPDSGIAAWRPPIAAPTADDEAPRPALHGNGSKINRKKQTLSKPGQTLQYPGHGPGSFHHNARRWGRRSGHHQRRRIGRFEQGGGCSCQTSCPLSTTTSGIFRRHPPGGRHYQIRVVLMKSGKKETNMPCAMDHRRTKTIVIRIVFCIVLVTGLSHSYRSSALAGDAPPIVFTDAAGMAVELPRPPQRIVVVGQAPYILMHMLYMFPEAGRRLAGYERKVKGLAEFVALIDPDTASKVALEGNPGPEHIAAVDPDLILMKSNTPGPLEKALAPIDIPVVHLDVENPEQFLKTIDLLGLLLGNPQRAKEIRTYYQDRLDRVAKATRDLTEKEKPRVLFMKYGDRTGDTAMQVPGSQWIQTQQTQLAGGNPVWLDRNAYSQNWQVVGFEQIALWDPEAIFIVVWYQLQNCEVINRLTADNKWRKLKAVAEKRFFLMPEDIFSWDSPDPRWILGLLWMTSKLHPERFGPWDIQSEVTGFFQEMYGMDRTAIEAHILSKVTMNGCR